MKRLLTLLALALLCAKSADSHCSPAPCVTLTWHASGTPGVWYNVYESGHSGGPYTKLNVNHITALTWVNWLKIHPQFRCYVVTAQDTTGESVHSNESCVQVP